jgi:DUF4097 and DUF4098 domain-containing protein YvlB
MLLNLSSVGKIESSSGNMTLAHSFAADIKTSQGNVELKNNSSTAQVSAATSGPYELTITHNYDFSRSDGSSHLNGRGNTTTIIDDDGITINGRKIL